MLSAIGETVVSPGHEATRGNGVQDDELAWRLRALADDALAQRRSHANALDRLSLLRRLRTVLDTAEGDATATARRQGHVWADVGGALGMSGQGAAKRLRTHHQRSDPGRDRRHPR